MGNPGSATVLHTIFKCIASVEHSFRQTRKLHRKTNLTQTGSGQIMYKTCFAEQIYTVAGIRISAIISSVMKSME